VPKLTTKKSTVSPERLNFIEPMYARSVQRLPEGNDWVYEVKFDGYRCLAGKDSPGVTLWSRRANRFTDQFPTIAEACQHLPPDTLLDGEIIALDQNGRISFNMLQHHRSQAQTILFYAFDVIIHRGRRLIHVPLETRRELLSDIAADLKRRTPLIGLSDTLDTTPAELIPLVKQFGLRVSSPSERIPVTRPGSDPAHGSNTK
jgi:ATP-dependent DNA ligase